MTATTLMGVAALIPGPARAGTYTAWYCGDGSGTALAGAERDWSPAFSGAGSSPDPVSCVDPPSGRIIRTVDADPDNSPDEVTNDAVLLAPARVTLSHVRLWWHGLVSDGSQVAAIALTGGSTPVGGVYDGEVLVDYRSTFGVTDPISYAPASYVLPTNTTGLLLRSACLPGSGMCETAAFAQFEAYRIAVTATDSIPPQGTTTGGLVSDPALVGQPSATVDATDEGAGVLAARVLVDGQVRATTAFGDRLCRDIDSTNSDGLEFSSISPCPPHASATVQLDASAIGDDAYHRVEVQVIDAAGNATTLSDRIVGMPGPSVPGFFDRATRRFRNPALDLAAPRQRNGDGASSGAILRVYLPVQRTVPIRHGAKRGQRRRFTRGTSRRTVAFTSRPLLRALLTDAARRPIAGAKVWVASRVDGQEWQIAGPARTTGRTGRIGLRVRSRFPSRQVNVVYFPFSDSHEQVVGRPVKLNVRAGITLSVNRHRARNGQRVRFVGHVAGPLAPGGVTVSLQVRFGHEYRTFRALRATAPERGAFRTTYRFTATKRPTRYRFRALVSRQPGLPYSRGTSQVSSVVVTP